MAAGGGGALPEGIGKNGRATKACPVRPFRPPAFILLDLTCVTLFFTFPSPQAYCFETLSLGLLVRDYVCAMEQLTDKNDAARDTVSLASLCDYGLLLTGGLLSANRSHLLWMVVARTARFWLSVVHEGGGAVAKGSQDRGRAARGRRPSGMGNLGLFWMEIDERGSTGKTLGGYEGCMAPPMAWEMLRTLVGVVYTSHVARTVLLWRAGDLEARERAVVAAADCG